MIYQPHFTNIEANTPEQTQAREAAANEEWRKRLLMPVRSRLENTPNASIRITLLPIVRPPVLSTIPVRTTENTAISTPQPTPPGLRTVPPTPVFSALPVSPSGSPLPMGPPPTLPMTMAFGGGNNQEIGGMASDMIYL